MKACYILILMVLATTLSATTPYGENKKMELPRLTAIDEFPEKYRDAVRAAIAKMLASGGKAQEYFADISSTKEGVFEIYLRHESHPTDDSTWRGDPCGRCRITRYDSTTGKVSKLQGIR